MSSDMARAETGHVGFAGISKNFGFQSMLNKELFKVWGHRSVDFKRLRFYRLCVESKKNGTNEPIYKTEIHRQKTNLWLPKGTGAGGGINWDIGIDIYTLLYIKSITNKNLLHSTGNSTQYSVMPYMGTESKKEWIYVYA